MLGEDAERFLAGMGVLVVVRRLAVAGGGEGLVHGDLHARHLAAVEAAQRDRVARGIGDAEHLGTADLLGLLLRRVEDEIGLGEAEGLVGDHSAACTYEPSLPGAARNLL